MVRKAVLITALLAGLTIWFITATDTTVNALSPLEYFVGACGAYIFMFIFFSVFIVFPAMLASEKN